MNKVMISTVAILSLLWACASDKCADGKCGVTQSDADWGTSRVLALNPSTGDVRWGIDFQGETVEIRRLEQGGKTVVFSPSDPCFDTERQFAFGVENGSQAVCQYDNDPEEIAYCDHLAIDGVAGWQYVNGFCVGYQTASGELIAIDLADSSEVWRAPIKAIEHFTFGNVLLALVEVTIEERVHYRLMRIAITNGTTVWMHQQIGTMVPLGADTEYVFVLGLNPFALNVATGDLGWEYIEDGLTFVPSRDGGKLLGDVLYVKWQHALHSTCAN